MKKKNLIGKRFSKLVVKEEAGKDKWNKILYKCECDCGQTVVTLGRQLNIGRTKSCGCLQKERASHANRKHDLRGTRIYRAWRTMQDKRGTGIFVEPEWKDVLRFEVDMGNMPSDKHVLSRIDLAEGFTKTNTIWDTTFKKLNYELLVGQVFTKLTVVGKGKSLNGVPRLNCVCECGNITTATKYMLVHKEKQSCGCLDPRKSLAEVEIGDYIESLGITIQRNVKTLFVGTNKEADIFVPSKKLVIEYDGVFWHSTKIAHSRFNILEKTRVAEANGYRCIHVREDQWLERPRLIKELLKAQLGIFTNRIGARKTIKKAIGDADYKAMADSNHLQGYRPAKYKQGLFTKDTDELVACISYNDAGELIRYVVKNGWQVQGALPKLMRNELIKFSFCDLTFFNGKSYPKAGFVLDYITKPNYRYAKANRTVSRNSMMKHKLKDKLNTFDEALTEEENCNNDGWYRIYDCGNAKYILPQLIEATT